MLGHINHQRGDTGHWRGDIIICFSPGVWSIDQSVNKTSQCLKKLVSRTFYTCVSEHLQIELSEWKEGVTACCRKNLKFFYFCLLYYIYCETLLITTIRHMTVSIRIIHGGPIILILCQTSLKWKSEINFLLKKCISWNIENFLFHIYCFLLHFCSHCSV